MKNKTFLFFAAVMFLFTVDSCQHHYPVSLVEADSLVYPMQKIRAEKRYDKRTVTKSDFCDRVFDFR